MNHRNSWRNGGHWCFNAAVLVAISATLAEPSGAAMFTGASDDGHTVSATAEFTAEGDTLTVKLTNATATTFDAAELFTGIQFSLNGLTPTLTSVTGNLRTIASDGTWADSSSVEYLSWSLVSVGDDLWQLNFSPDARHGIVGPPNENGYDDANPSVRGNPGHNPFAAEMLVAELNVPGLGDATGPLVAVASFFFSGASGAEGTIIPGGGLEVPEPPTWIFAISASAVMACASGWRRRHNSSHDDKSKGHSQLSS